MRQSPAQSGSGGLRAQLMRGAMGSAGVQGSSRVLALVLGIVLARVLGAEDYGIYVYAIAIMNILMIVAEAGVPPLLMREVAAAHGSMQWGLLQGAVMRSRQFVLLVSIGVTVVGYTALWWFSSGMEKSEAVTTALMLTLIPFSALAKTYAHVLRGLHHIVIGQVLELLLRPVLVLVFVVALFLLSPEYRQAEYVMGCQLLGIVLVLLISKQLLKRYQPSELRDSKVVTRDREWLQSALPFTLIGGAWIINGQTDIIMLGWYWTPKDVGIYRVGVQGAGLAIFGLQVIIAVVSPQFSRMYAQGDTKRLQKLVTLSARLSLGASLPFICLFVFAGRDILLWVFGESYVDGYWPLAILSIGQLFNAAAGLLGFLLNMTGNEKDTATILWSSVILNIVLNFLLVPTYGNVGAASASAFSMVMWNIGLMVLVNRRLHLNPTVFNRL